MSVPQDCDMCPSNVREEPIDGLSIECGAERIGVWNLLKDTDRPPPSVAKNIRCVWHPTGSASSPSGVFPGPQGSEFDVCPRIPGPAKRRLGLRNLE